MAALLSRIDQAVSITDVVRTAKRYIDNLVAGAQDHYVVMRNNSPAVVMLSVETYQAMADELEDLRIAAVAAERLRVPVTANELIGHDEMVARFAGRENTNEQVDDQIPAGGGR
jgi:antitoxin StbD